MKKIIIANWKMNPKTVKQAVRLARAEDRRGVVIVPPFPFLSEVGGTLKRAKLGAQDVFWKEEGAYTGQISPLMLKGLGVKYVILGHSERRALGETDEMVNKKVKAAFRADLKVILCVGEPWSVRRKELSAAKNFVKKQLIEDLKSANKLMKLKANKLIIAYEPIWAIGTGRSDKPEQTLQMVKFIKELLVISHKSSVKVLYGGSVTSQNAANFLSQKEIDGALVGGASLRVSEFSRIIKSAE